MKEKRQRDFDVEVQEEVDEKPKIVFESISSLSDVDVQPISRTDYFFKEVGSGFLHAWTWIINFLFDIVKALGNVFLVAYRGAKSLVVKIYQLFQKHLRHFKEVDKSGKMSYLVMGFSSIKNGQFVNGILYMLSQIGFILFMVFYGANNLYKFTGPGLIPFQKPGWDPVTERYLDFVAGDSSIQCMLYGLITIILIFAFIYVYFRNLNVVSDNDKIAYGPRYVKAYEAQIDFLVNIDKYIDKISHEREHLVKIKGKTQIILKRHFFSRPKIRKILKDEFKMPKLTILYISYLPFRKIVTQRDALISDASFELMQFHHKFDRFNDYDDVNYKASKLLFAYENEKVVLDAIYARDSVSIKNNVTPINEGERISKKEAVSRLITALDVDVVVANMIFSLGFHNAKISAEKHRFNYGRLQNYIRRFNEKNSERYHGRSSTFVRQVSGLMNEGFAGTVLFLPVTFATTLVILPLLFTIFVAFTNFNGTNSGNNLFKWVGFENFATLFAGTGANQNMSATIWALLGWTLVWAFFATFLNYILGMILALLINKKGIKLKKMWRTIFVVTIAIPQFVSLLAMSRILGDAGPVNTWLMQNFGQMIPFLSDGRIAKVTVIVVNCWVGVPYTMLITSGILMNIPEDLYESARIDGAGPFTQFTKITLPYMLFVTGPYLITQFIGNINNFNVIFFLTGGQPNYPIYYKANQTDLLITWLYKITTGSGNEYNVASTLGIFIFIICAFLSLIMYARIGSTKREEDFQ